MPGCCFRPQDISLLHARTAIITITFTCHGQYDNVLFTRVERRVVFRILISEGHFMFQMNNAIDSEPFKAVRHHTRSQQAHPTALWMCLSEMRQVYDLDS
jgi:hypothetical protein